MRLRNPDFVDRYLDLERKVRRRTTLSTEGEWIDLRPYLGPCWVPQTATPIARLTDGFVELAGSVACVDSNNSQDIILDLPEGFYPDGGNFGGSFGVTDIWLAIDYDNHTDRLPFGGGWSADCVGDPGGGGSTARDIIIDAAPVVINQGSPPVLEAPGAGNNNGWPMDGIVVLLNGVSWMADGELGAQD